MVLGQILLFMVVHCMHVEYCGHWMETGYSWVSDENVWGTHMTKALICLLQI